MSAEQTGSDVDAPTGGIDSLIETAARARTNLERRQSETSKRLERVERLQQELRELVDANGSAPA